MKLYYQWNPGSYGNIASIEASESLASSEVSDIKGFPDFDSVWKEIWGDTIACLPVENSYMGTIHPNLYSFLKYDHKIIWEVELPINHCLLSKESKIDDVKEAYSQMPALLQTTEYCASKNIEQVDFYDTAWAAKMISEEWKPGMAAIASKLAWEIYGLNILDECIQDQKWNATRFFVVVPKNMEIEFAEKKNKVSILFEGKNMPSVLYKCLGAFATNNINLTKIESLPSFKTPYTNYFWLDFEWNLEEERVKNALKELEFFTKDIRILWEY